MSHIGLCMSLVVSDIGPRPSKAASSEHFICQA